MRHKGQTRTDLEECLWQALYEYYAAKNGVQIDAVIINGDEAAIALVVVATELAACYAHPPDRFAHYDIIKNVATAARDALENNSTVGLEWAKRNDTTLI